MTFLYQATILQAKTSTRIISVTIQLNHGPSRDCSVQYGADKKVYIEKTALTLKEKQYIYIYGSSRASFKAHFENFTIRFKIQNMKRGN
jgi:hypothetical protein